MTRYLTATQIGRINERYDGGGLTDENRAGVEAAAHRPQSQFAGHEPFPTIWDKAGALLHGLCSTQYFGNGNKRTAWMSAVAFLRANRYRLPPVPDIEAEAFVLAVSTIRDFGADRAAEWFESASRRYRPGHTQDPRLEYLMLAGAAQGTAGSTLDIAQGHVGMISARELPDAYDLTLVTRIHWRATELGLKHRIKVTVEDVDGLRVIRPRAAWTTDLAAPAVGGHSFHVDGIMPILTSVVLPMSIIRPGDGLLNVAIDGEFAGQIPLKVQLEPAGWADVAPGWLL